MPLESADSTIAQYSLTRQPPLELTRQPSGCLFGLGPEDDAGSGPIEPVHEPDVCRMRIVRIEIAADRRFERTFTLGRPGTLRELSGRFGECQAVVVFEQDGQGLAQVMLRLASGVAA